MRRDLHRAVLAGGLALGLFISGASGAGADRGRPSGPHADDTEDPRVAGLVYRIREFEWATRLRVYDQNLARDVYVYLKDPALRELVWSGQVCTNRYVVAVGVRINPEILEGQGLEVDLGRPCGEAPR